MNTAQLLQKLQGLVDTKTMPPTEQWAGILRLLEHSDNPEAVSVFLPTLAKLDIPPDLRKAPKTWIKALLAGQPPLWLTLTTTLDLRKMQLNDEAMAKLADCKFISKVNRIKLYRNQVGSPGVTALANSFYLGNLEALNLAYNRVGASGATALANSDKLPALKHLYLGRNRIGDKGARALASSPLLKRLQILDVSDNNLTDEGRTQLSNSPYLTGCKLVT